MKKIILIVSLTLVLGMAAFAGCSGTNMGSGNSAPDNSYNMIQNDEKQPSDNGTVKPQPREPRADKRTSDDNCEDGDCKENKHECPHCKPRMPRLPRRGDDIIPVPRPAPVQPKN